MRFVSPCIVVLAGPSGAGKSAWASTNFAANEIVSSDQLRGVVGIDESDQQASTDAFFLLDQILTRRVARRLTTVIDTLGYDEQLRMAAIERARAAGLPVYAVGFDTPPDVCRARNAARTRPIPKSVLTKQLATWKKVRPLLESEDFDAVHIVTDDSGEEAATVPTSMAHADAAAARQAASPQRLRFGLQISSFTWPDDKQSTRQRLTSIAQAAESAGFSSVWVMDHFRQIPQVGRAWEDMLESYTTLSFLAGVTERIRLGTLVTGIPYRNPAHLGKIIATLDVLSGGRAICGLGAGWFRQEAEGYGWDWPDTTHRYDLLEDSLRLLPLLWGPGNPPFEGTRITVPEAMCYPRPIQDRIPILVGGSGEKKTLRLVAKYADMCNLFGDPATVAHKTDVLHRHCADLGRDPATITISHLTTALVGRDRIHVRDLVEELRPANESPADYSARVNAATVDDHIGRFREYVEAGSQLAIVNMPNGNDATAIQRFAPIIAAFHTDQ